MQLIWCQVFSNKESESFRNDFSNNTQFTTALVVELILQSRIQRSRNVCFHSLLWRILPIAIDDFELAEYCLYLEQRIGRRGGVEPYFQDSDSLELEPRCRIDLQSDLIGLGHDVKVARSIEPAELFRSFLDFAQVHNVNSPLGLLLQMETQASELSTEHVGQYLLEFLIAVTALVDTSSSEVQHAVQSLLATYIQRFVRHKPVEPRDWARPEEQIECSIETDCSTCAAFNTFLRDPHLESYQIPIGGWHRTYWVHSNFDWCSMRSQTATHWDIAKTLKHHQQKYADWMNRCSKAREGLVKISDIKRLLGDKYEEMMEAITVQAGSDSP